MTLSKVTEFSSRDHQVWKSLFRTQETLRESQMHPIFIDGLKKLDILGDKIPDLAKVNRNLKRESGFEGIYVEGLEDGKNFYNMLSNKKFPIGNFIRDIENLSYTPAPDVFHDLYGHLPFLANKAYADFCCEYGKRAILYVEDLELFRQFERFFWFAVEFALIETPKGRRIAGGGIASSFKECEYALSPKPMIRPFDIDEIRRQEFAIDQIQNKLFVLKNLEQLYSSIDLLEAKINQTKRSNNHVSRNERN